MEQKNKISVRFLGAAGTVTGSKYLIETSDKKILIDCGLFQGLKELRNRNWTNLPVDASAIDCVLLTHGHLDHVGYLPLLVKQGFIGKIYATAPTIEITKLILRDSAKIQEEDADQANAFKYTKHKPAKPLYNTKEAEAVLPLLFSSSIDRWIEIFPQIFFRLKYNAHILGAVFIELKIYDKLFVFSGDIGREDPLMCKPEKPQDANFLFIESTYGNKIHPDNAKELLMQAINQAASLNGTIIIPGFAVERTQLLMYYIWKLQAEMKIPLLPVYMDSPMGSSVLSVFQKFPEWHKLKSKEYTEMCQDIKLIKNPEETEQLACNKMPKIIIAGSGMASGGRVLTYFEHYLNNESATIILAGYQGEGTRGRSLLDGAKEIKMRGKFWPVKANIVMVEGLSAHADQNELIDWLSDLKSSPEKVFIVHGEKQSAEGLQQKIKEKYNWNSEIPQFNDIAELQINNKALPG